MVTGPAHAEDMTTFVLFVLGVGVWLGLSLVLAVAVGKAFAAGQSG